MPRPHIEFIQSQEIAPEPVAAGPFAGVASRRLSRDETSGAATELLRLEAGFSADVATDGRPLELLVLDGALTVAGQPLGAGGYVYLEPSVAPRLLVAERPTEALVMSEPVGERQEDPPVVVHDTVRMPWMDRTLPDVPPGLTVKMLRRDEGTGDRTWMAALVPGWTERRAEQHPTVEEAFILRGEGLLGTRGVLRAGAYFWRPPMVEHGPMATREGQLVFFRTKGGDLDVSYVEVPDADRMLDDYRNGAPFYSPAIVGSSS